MPSTDDMPPLFQRMIDRTPEEVEEVLREEWSTIKSPVVARFRDALLEQFSPFALARTTKPIFLEREWYLLLLGRENYRSSVFVDAYGLTFPDNVLEGFAPGQRDVIREFFESFAGLCSELTSRDIYYRLERWNRSEDSLYEYLLGISPDVRDSWPFYCTSSGEHLLVDHDGRVSWLLTGASEKADLARNFGEFVELLIGSLQGPFPSPFLQYYTP